ncbi:MAG TPA: hypothetical protein VH328_11010, partial [Burkholderiaceae bacterium]|nr:hypothetical protein [Burkholderiaceae bacterium]
MTFKNDDSEDYFYFDGKYWCNDNDLPAHRRTAEQQEQNRQDIAYLLRNDRCPVQVVNRIFKDDRVKSAFVAGLTVGDLDLIKGRRDLYGAMHEAEGAMRCADRIDKSRGDSYQALCDRHSTQELLALYDTAELSKDGCPVHHDENWGKVEQDGPAVFENHERAALQTIYASRALSAFSARLARKYGPETAQAVFNDAAFIDGMRKQEFHACGKYQMAFFSKRRFWTFLDTKAEIAAMVKQWTRALPDKAFLAAHAESCFIRGVLKRDWKLGEQRRSAGRAEVMLASASHYVVGARGDRPLLESERKKLQCVIGWIEQQCVHHRLEQGDPPRDTLPWYVALHQTLEKGVVPPASWMFEDVEREVE